MAESLGSLFAELVLKKAPFVQDLKAAEAALTSTGNGLAKFADAVQGKFNLALKVGAASLALMGKQMVQTGAQFDAQIGSIAARAGVAASEMGAITDKARELGKTTLFTATEAAAGMEELAKAGLSVAEVMVSAEDALKLAGVAGMSMDEASTMLVSTMRQFGLAASETGRISDVMAKAMNASLLDANSLADAMKYAGTTGAGFGMSLEETVAVVAKFRDLGLEGSIAGNAFKFSLLNAGRASKKQQDALQQLGLTLEDINPEVHSFAEILKTVADAGKGAAAGSAMFGSRAGLNVMQLAKLAKEGKLGLDELIDSLKNAEGSTEEAYKKLTDGVMGRFTLMKSALEDLFLEIFESFRDPLRELMGELGPFFNALSESFGKNKTSVEILGGLIRQLAAYIRDNRDELVEAVQTGARWLAEMSETLARMLPLLKEVGQMMVAAFAAEKVLRFAVFLDALPVKLAKVAAGTRAVGAAMGPVGMAVLALTAAFTALQASMEWVNKETAAKEAELQRPAKERLEAIGKEIDALYTEEDLLQKINEAAKEQKRYKDASYGGGDTTAQNNALQEAKALREELKQRLPEYSKVMVQTTGAISETSAQYAKERLTLLEAEIRAKENEFRGMQARAQQEEEAAAKAEAAALALAEAEKQLQTPPESGDDGAQYDSTADDALKERQKALESVRSLLRDLAGEVGDQILDAEGKVERAYTERIKTIEATFVEARKVLGDTEMLAAQQAQALVSAYHIYREEMEALFEEAKKKYQEAREEMEAWSGEVDAAAAALKEAAKKAEIALAPVTVWVSVLSERLKEILAPVDAFKAGMEATWRDLEELLEGTTTSLERFGLMAGWVVGNVKDLTGNLLGMADALTGGMLSSLGVGGGISGMLSSLLGLAGTEGEEVDLNARISELQQQGMNIAAATTQAQSEAGSTSGAGEAAQELVDQALAFVQGVADNLDIVITTLINGIPSVLDALVKALPKVIQVLATLLPDLIVILISYMDDIAIALIRGIFTEFIPRIPEIVWEMATTFLEAVGDFFQELLQDFLEKLTFWKDEDEQKSNKEEREEEGDSRFQNYMEKVFPWLEEDDGKQEEKEKTDSNSESAARTSGRTDSRRGGEVRVVMQVDGQVVDGAVVNASKKGISKVQRMMRRTSGVRVGVDP